MSEGVAKRRTVNVHLQGPRIIGLMLSVDTGKGSLLMRRINWCTLRYETGEELFSRLEFRSVACLKMKKERCGVIHWVNI